MGETPSLTGEFVGETHRVMEYTQTNPPGNQHQKGPICSWVSGKVTESQPKPEQVALFPLGPLSHRPCHNCTTEGCSAPYHVTSTPRQKKHGPNERTDQTSRKNTTKRQTANLSDAQFKTLVIRMLTEMVVCSSKIEEKVKTMKSEIKENYREPTVTRGKLGLQINSLKQKEEINIQTEQNEETRI